MTAGSTYVQHIHYIRIYFDDEGEGGVQELHGHAIGFMGNRVDGLWSTPVLLPKSCGWKWMKMYPVNANKVWAPTQDGMEDMNVPAILYIPYFLVSFALEQPQMCWEMHKEIVQVSISDCNELTGEDFKLLTNWFVVAAHGTAGKSILSLKMQTLATLVSSFQRWARMRLNCTMGREMDHIPVPQTNVPPPKCNQQRKELLFHPLTSQ